MSAGPKLPPQLHVFVRDWLSSNNVLLKSRDGHVLIDSGYVRHAPLTMALLATPAGIGNEPLARLVNTHCHSDHIGGNATIKAHYRCPIALPEAEAPLIDRWDEMAMLLGYCDQRTDRFGYDEVIRPGETHVWGGLEWRALAAPGHDMAALVFHNPEHGILISGDALWENGYGLVMPKMAHIDAAIWEDEFCSGRALFRTLVPAAALAVHVSDRNGRRFKQMLNGKFRHAFYFCFLTPHS